MKKVLCLIAVLVISSDAASMAVVKKARRAAAAGSSGVVLQTPNPTNPLEHNNRGVELGSKGLWPDAIREHEEALNGDPENQTFRTNLSAANLSYARVLARTNKTYEAMNRYREALYADPNNLAADAELDQLIQKSNKKSPTDLAVRQNLAEDAEANGNFPVAIVEYRKCIRIRDSGVMHARLGTVLLKQQKPVDGFLELKLALNKDWAPTEKKELAETHKELGEILKTYAEVAENAGKMSLAVKRLDNAAIEFRRAVTVLPDMSDAQRGLVEVAREAVGINPNSFDNHLMLGSAYQISGDYERAKDEYEKCFRINRTDPRLALARRSYHLAVVSHPSIASPIILAATMQKVENSLAENPNDPELLYIYGRGKEAQQDPSSALRAYQAASAINPLIFPDLQERIRSLAGGGVQAAAGTPGALPGTPGAPGGKPGVPGPVGTVSAPGTPIAPPEPPNNGALYADIESKISANSLDDAEKKASEIVSKTPRDAHGWFLLGKVREKQNSLEEASVAYRMANSLKDPDAKAAMTNVDVARTKPLLDQAEQLIGQNKNVEAASALKDAIQLAPALPSLHQRLAEVLRKTGDEKAAQAEDKKVENLQKNDK
jgi:tetratricopeptide (TPR) repeat protein